MEWSAWGAWEPEEPQKAKAKAQGGRGGGSEAEQRRRKRTAVHLRNVSADLSTASWLEQQGLRFDLPRRASARSEDDSFSFFASGASAPVFFPRVAGVTLPVLALRRGTGETHSAAVSAGSDSTWSGGVAEYDAAQEPAVVRSRRREGVAPRDVMVACGNEAGEPLHVVSLEHYLRHYRMFVRDPDALPGTENSFFAAADESVAVEMACAFVPAGGCAGVGEQRSPAPTTCAFDLVYKPRRRVREGWPEGAWSSGGRAPSLSSSWADMRSSSERTCTPLAGSSAPADGDDGTDPEEPLTLVIVACAGGTSSHIVDNTAQDRHVLSFDAGGRMQPFVCACAEQCHDRLLLVEVPLTSDALERQRAAAVAAAAAAFAERFTTASASASAASSAAFALSSSPSSSSSMVCAHSTSFSSSASASQRRAFDPFTSPYRSMVAAGDSPAHAPSLAGAALGQCMRRRPTVPPCPVYMHDGVARRAASPPSDVFAASSLAPLTGLPPLGMSLNPAAPRGSASAPAAEHDLDDDCLSCSPPFLSSPRAASSSPRAAAASAAVDIPHSPLRYNPLFVPQRGDAPHVAPAPPAPHSCPLDGSSYLASSLYPPLASSTVCYAPAGPLSTDGLRRDRSKPIRATCLRVLPLEARETESAVRASVYAACPEVARGSPFNPLSLVRTTMPGLAPAAPMASAAYVVQSREMRRPDAAPPAAAPLHPTSNLGAGVASMVADDGAGWEWCDEAEEGGARDGDGDADEECEGDKGGMRRLEFSYACAANTPIWWKAWWSEYNKLFPQLSEMAARTILFQSRRFIDTTFEEAEDELVNVLSTLSYITDDSGVWVK